MVLIKINKICAYSIYFQNVSQSFRLITIQDKITRYSWKSFCYLNFRYPNDFLILSLWIAYVMSLQLLTTWLISGCIGSSLVRMGRFGEQQSSINWVRVCSSRVSKMVQVGKNLSTTLRSSGRILLLTSAVPLQLVRICMISWLGAGISEPGRQSLHWGSEPLSKARVLNRVGQYYRNCIAIQFWVDRIAGNWSKY